MQLLRPACERARRAGRLDLQLDSSQPVSCQSWNISRVQSGLRWSRTPARCSRDPAGDLVGPEEPLARQPVGVEQRSSKGPSGPRSQRATGMPNPFFGPVEDRRREPTRSRALEQPLGLAPSVFVTTAGSASIRVDQRGVEERRADLQAAGHARAVDLGQDVVGQVRILVEGQRPRQRVGPGASAAARRRCSASTSRLARRSGAARSPGPRTSRASAGAPAAAARPRRGGTA